MTPEQFQQARALFLEACDLARGERAGFLDARCDDEEVRQAVESWLAEDDRPQPLDSPADVPATLTGTTSARGLLRRELSGGTSAGSSVGGARFLPGTTLDGRYRIIGLLGRGGMGEVYRADDLKLGQPVALKFLPPGLDRDEKRLQRFINEVRTARQVTHINVCRVYDVGDVDGQHYLSMEYVDGEDLASLLRRIGRLPHDKAVQISRQIAAGLHAAHEQGILHRDLKPANVMIDGRGQVKITDFGLAELEETIRGTDIRCGTPAYMAPEQLAGEAVTVRSDIYALGLVLYELFTGAAAFEASSLEEWMELHRTATPTSPSSHVEGFDRTVEKTILRCLEKDPRDRPSSALAVAAALPGGDPLVAALKAGETPSPDIVAAAGAKGLLPKPIALGLLAVVVASIIGSVFLADRVWLVAHAAPPKTPVRLAEDAAEMIARLRDHGLLPEAMRTNLDAAYGFQPNWGYLRERRRQSDLAARHALDADRPAAFRFWYRQSPWALHAESTGVTPHRVSPSRPNPYRRGMVNIRLDPSGRLLRLTAIPRSAFKRDDDSEPVTTQGWQAMFAEAGLDFETFTKDVPTWSPPTDCDQREAWIGTPVPGLEIRVEAGAVRGKVVAFVVLMPWQVPTGSTSGGDRAGADIEAMIELPVYIFFTVGALLLAWRNVRRRRGDRRGAWRLWVFVFVVGLAYWVLSISRFPRGAAGFVPTFRQAIAIVLFWATFSGLLYFAVEPYIRRRWPERMIAWSRALAGRWRDPLVGREVLIGTASGFGVLALTTAIDVLMRVALDLPERIPSTAPFSVTDLRTSIGALFMTALRSPSNAFIALVLVLLLKIVLRKLWLAIAVLGIIMTLQFAPPDPDLAVWRIVKFGIETGVFFIAIFRFGLLAGIAWCFGYFVLQNHPGAPDLWAWYAAPAVTGYLAVAALAVYGFLVSQAGRPLVSDKVMEE